MLSLRLYLAAALLAISASFAMADDRFSRPTERNLETFLRDQLAQDGPGLHSLDTYRNAILLDFELLELEPAASSRWVAKVELLFDFGPPPPAVLGYLRVRRGPYELLLQRQGRALELLRFTPLAEVHPLPVFQ